MYTNNHKPFIQIIEEPANLVRFEYEDNLVQTISGRNSTNVNRTMPAIQIIGYIGEIYVIVSCVTKDGNRPHPHSLIGTNCKNGIYQAVKYVHANSIIYFEDLAITKQINCLEALTKRKQMNVDPCQTGFSHIKYLENIDLNVVRLGFQVIIKDRNGKLKPLRSIVSRSIYNRNFETKLKIIKLSHTCCNVQGGKEIIILCNKLNRTATDVIIRFFQVKHNKKIWENYGEFNNDYDMHKDLVIIVRTPKYYRTDILEPEKCYIQLYQPSNGDESEPIPFYYIPKTSKLCEYIVNIECQQGRKRRKIINESILPRILEDVIEVKAEENYSSNSDTDNINTLSVNNNTPKKMFLDETSIDLTKKTGKPVLTTSPSQSISSICSTTSSIKIDMDIIGNMENSLKCNVQENNLWNVILEEPLLPLAIPQPITLSPKSLKTPSYSCEPSLYYCQHEDSMRTGQPLNMKWFGILTIMILCTFIFSIFFTVYLKKQKCCKMM